MRARALAWHPAGERAGLSYLLVAAALVIAVLVLGEELGRHLDNLEQWLSRLGPWALLAFLCCYALLSAALVPDTLLGIVAGATFGLGRGFLLATGGSILAGLLEWSLSRRLLKPGIDRLVARRPGGAAIRAAVRREELKLQLLLRLAPLNRAMTSYLLGASGVGLPRFLLAYLAVVPHLVVEVYFGAAGRHLARSAGQAGHSVLAHDGLLLGGLLAVLGVLAYVSRMARRAVEASAAAADGEVGTTSWPGTTAAPGEGASR